MMPTSHTEMEASSLLSASLVRTVQDMAREVADAGWELAGAPKVAAGNNYFTVRIPVLYNDNYGQVTVILGARTKVFGYRRIQDRLRACAAFLHVPDNYAYPTMVAIASSVESRLRKLQPCLS